jgi:hypothetical protein
MAGAPVERCTPAELQNVEQGISNEEVPGILLTGRMKASTDFEIR